MERKIRKGVLISIRKNKPIEKNILQGRIQRINKQG